MALLKTGSFLNEAQSLSLFKRETVAIVFVGACASTPIKPVANAPITEKEFSYKTLSYVNYLPLKYELCNEIWEYLYTSYHKLSRNSSQPYLREIILDFPELEWKLKTKND